MGDGSPVNSTPCTVSLRIRRAISIPPQPTMGSAFRNSYTKVWGPSRKKTKASCGRKHRRSNAEFLICVVPVRNAEFTASTHFSQVIRPLVASQLNESLLRGFVAPASCRWFGGPSIQRKYTGETPALRMPSAPHTTSPGFTRRCGSLQPWKRGSATTFGVSKKSLDFQTGALRGGRTPQA